MNSTMNPQLTIQIPSFPEDARFCYMCNRIVADGYAFCDNICEEEYEDEVANGDREPDFRCVSCNYYMNPNQGEWTNICHVCDFSDGEDEWDAPAPPTPAQAYRNMFPYNKSIPHEKMVAVNACNEFMANVNSASGHMDKCFHAKFLFQYLADHGHVLFENLNFCEAVEGKMKEMENYEATMNFYNFSEVFARLRKMIAHAQKED